MANQELKRGKTYYLLPLSSMKTILKNGGAKKVSNEAQKELSRRMEEYGQKIAEKVAALAKHAGRKVVKRKDVVEAFAL